MVSRCSMLSKYKIEYWLIWNSLEVSAGTNDIMIKSSKTSSLHPIPSHHWAVYFSNLFIQKKSWKLNTYHCSLALEHSSWIGVHQQCLSDVLLRHQCQTGSTLEYFVHHLLFFQLSSSKKESGCTLTWWNKLELFILSNEWKQGILIDLKILQSSSLWISPNAL